MEAALAAIRERGYREAILWVLAGNHRAQAFYERRGWNRDGGDRPGEYPGVTFASAAERPREIRYRHRLDA
jgi:ribosomal protein S18 acetylase RimI-like enzyme